MYFKDWLSMKKIQKRTLYDTYIYLIDPLDQYADEDVKIFDNELCFYINENGVINYVGNFIKAERDSIESFVETYKNHIVDTYDIDDDYFQMYLYLIKK